jgi:hypothetical protein
LLLLPLRSSASALLLLWLLPPLLLLLPLLLLPLLLLLPRLLLLRLLLLSSSSLSRPLLLPLLLLLLAHMALFDVCDNVFGGFVSLCALVCPLWCSRVLVLARMALFGARDVFVAFGGRVSLCAFVCPLWCACGFVSPLCRRLSSLVFVCARACSTSLVWCV